MRTGSATDKFASAKTPWRLCGFARDSSSEELAQSRKDAKEEF
jgi:hypothetical protein